MVERHASALAVTQDVSGGISGPASTALGSGGAPASLPVPPPSRSGIGGAEPTAPSHPASERVEREHAMIVMKALMVMTSHHAVTRGRGPLLRSLRALWAAASSKSSARRASSTAGFHEGPLSEGP